MAVSISRPADQQLALTPQRQSHSTPCHAHRVHGQGQSVVSLERLMEVLPKPFSGSRPPFPATCSLAESCWWAHCAQTSVCALSERATRFGVAQHKEKFGGMRALNSLASTGYRIPHLRAVKALSADQH